MAGSPGQAPGGLEDPRVYLAVERTFLAWLRTGLALMGFGFVMARFGLFLQEIATGRSIRPIATHGVSLRFGTALVLLGALLNVFAVIRYTRLLRRLADRAPLIRPSRIAIALAVLLATIGGTVSVLLMLGW